jgi:hypothetical protein
VRADRAAFGTSPDHQRCAVDDKKQYVYRGGPGLLALITTGNLANLSIFSPAIPGPEQYLAGRPLLLVTFIFVHIVVSLVLVGVLARRNTDVPAERPADHQLAAQHR